MDCLDGAKRNLLLRLKGPVVLLWLVIGTEEQLLRTMDAAHGMGGADHSCGVDLGQGRGSIINPRCMAQRDCADPVHDWVGSNLLVWGGPMGECRPCRLSSRRHLLRLLRGRMRQLHALRSRVLLLGGLKIELLRIN